MDRRAQLTALLETDALRLAALSAVRELLLPDCWIGAGFVRDAVWDHLHGIAPEPPAHDIDVVWFCRDLAHEACDRALEQLLGARMPDLRWSVKNQARMHRRNGDAPYASVAMAMEHWPETATAVAVRMNAAGQIDVNAPLGLEDLFHPRVVPAPHFRGHKRAVFEERLARKGWLERYPLLVTG